MIRRIAIPAAAALSFTLVACDEAAPRDRVRMQAVAMEMPSVPAAAMASVARQASVAPGFDGRSQALDGARAVRLDAGARMLIRSGEMTLRVDSLDRALARLREVAAAVGAVLSGSSTHTGDDAYQSATATLRLQSEHFDRAIEGLRRIGFVEGVSVATEDVGEEYVDVSARVTNGRRLEARLLGLLATRTGKLSDVVEVERELARVREHIEALEGRRRYLASHAALSTLTVNLHEPRVIVGVAGQGVMRQSFEQSWENFVWLMGLLIRSIGVVVPLALLASLAWGIARRFGWSRDSVGGPVSIRAITTHEAS